MKKIIIYFLSVIVIPQIFTTTAKAQSNKELKQKFEKTNLLGHISYGINAVQKIDTIKNLAILCSDTTTNFVFWMKGYAIPGKNIQIYTNATNYQINQALDYGTEYFDFYDKNGKPIKYIIYQAKILSKD